MKGGRGWRVPGAWLLMLCLACGLAGCTGSWFTPKLEGSLILAPPIGVGTRGEILISVSEMPDGGLATISIDSALGFLIGVKNVTASGEGASR